MADPNQLVTKTPSIYDGRLKLLKWFHDEITSHFYIMKCRDINSLGNKNKENSTICRRLCHLSLTTMTKINR